MDTNTLEQPSAKNATAHPGCLIPKPLQVDLLQTVSEHTPEPIQVARWQILNATPHVLQTAAKRAVVTELCKYIGIHRFRPMRVYLHVELLQTTYTSVVTATTARVRSSSISKHQTLPAAKLTVVSSASRIPSEATVILALVTTVAADQSFKVVFRFPSRTVTDGATELMGPRKLLPFVAPISLSVVDFLEVEAQALVEGMVHSLSTTILDFQAVML
ncbi:MAG: hypothetical protein Q9225_001773 [Loekoesia sp. 1 TL-2023]